MLQYLLFFHYRCSLYSTSYISSEKDAGGVKIVKNLVLSLGKRESHTMCTLYNVWWKLTLNWPKTIYIYQYFLKSVHLTCYFLIKNISSKHFDGTSIISAKYLTFHHSLFSLILCAKKLKKTLLSNVNSYFHWLYH